MNELPLSIIIMSIFSLGQQSASGIDIYQQQLDPIVPIPQSMKAPIESSSIPNIQREELETVRKKSDSIKFLDRRVRVIGTYQVEITKPDPGFTGNPNFQGTYTRARIVLTDGTEIPIFPSYHKQSLRSPEEVKIYTGKTVNVIGRIEFQSDGPGLANSTQSVMITSVDRICLDLDR